MQDGRLARETSPEPQKPFEKQNVSSTGIGGIPAVGWDIMRFFNVSFDDVNKGSTQEQLKDIEKWTYKDVETAGDGLHKLKQLEITLGVPQNGESRITKIHRWIKLEQHINDLRARQRSL